MLSFESRVTRRAWRSNSAASISIEAMSSVDILRCCAQAQTQRESPLPLGPGGVSGGGRCGGASHRWNSMLSRTIRSSRCMSSSVLSAPWCRYRRNLRSSGIRTCTPGNAAQKAAIFLRLGTTMRVNRDKATGGRVCSHRHSYPWLSWKVEKR